MAGLSFSGLTSGLDTAAIVDQLIAVERNPQVLLAQKRSKQNAVLTALQGLNTRLASLATAATALAKPETWTKPTATSSSSTVTVATTASSGSGSLSFDVTALAQRASVTTAPITDGLPPHTPRTFTISGTAPDFQPLTVTAASSNVRDMAQAINAADGAVVATAVPTGTGEYRLVVSAKLSGSGSLSVEGDAPAFTTLREGSDATLDLGGGVVVSSRSNTFAGLLGGSDVTVSAVEAGVTLTAAPDPKAVAKQAAGTVGALNVVLSEIASQTRAAVGSAGPLVGNSLLRGIQQQLATAVSTAVPGATLADLGIQLTREGTVTIDEAAFAAYAAKEPATAKALTTAFAEAVGAVATTASRTGTGLIAEAIASSQSTVKDLDARIAAFDDRLARRRGALERQFAALEVALQRSQSTQKYLPGALANLAGAS